MLIERSVDAERANAILNDSDVRPYVTESPGQPLDITPQLKNDLNVLYMGEYGLTLYLFLMSGSYEVHSAALARGRGSWMLEFARRSLDSIFTQSPAWEVLTRVPAGNLPALSLTKACGFSHEFDSMNPCFFDGKWVTPAIWRLSIHDWVKRSVLCEEIGMWFHDRLASEAQRLGIKQAPHPENEHHNRVAGAALLMARFGQPGKAKFFYNRWAGLSRHAMVELLCTNPVAFKMDIGVLRLKGDDIEVTRE